MTTFVCISPPCLPMFCFFTANFIVDIFIILLYRGCKVWFFFQPFSPLPQRNLPLLRTTCNQHWHLRGNNFHWTSKVVTLKLKFDKTECLRNMIHFFRLMSKFQPCINIYNCIYYIMCNFQRIKGKLFKK